MPVVTYTIGRIYICAYTFILAVCVCVCVCVRVCVRMYLKTQIQAC